MTNTSLSDASHPYIENVLVLHISHMPRRQPFFGYHKAAPFSGGFVVFTSPHDPVHWLKPIMRIAWRDDCTLILFDKDGPVDPELPEFDW